MCFSVCRGKGLSSTAWPRRCRQFEGGFTGNAAGCSGLSNRPVPWGGDWACQQIWPESSRFPARRPNRIFRACMGWGAYHGLCGRTITRRPGDLAHPTVPGQSSVNHSLFGTGGSAGSCAGTAIGEQPSRGSQSVGSTRMRERMD